MDNSPISKLLRRLWSHINTRRRMQFGLLLILMVFASFAEILSIGAVLPFLGALTAPEKVFAHSAVQPVIRALGLNTPEQLLFPLSLSFGAAALVAGATRLLLLWATNRLSFATGGDFSISIYRRTLYQPYAAHCARNSSLVISAVSDKAGAVIYSIIIPALNLVRSGVMLIPIITALIIIEPVTTIVAFSGFGLIYALIIFITRNRLLNDSRVQSRELVHVMKSLQEGLGGIRDVLVDGTQETYSKIYRDAVLSLRRAQGSSTFISESPRYAMEAMGMLLITMLAYLLANQEGGMGKAIPILGALALGAQRLLPIIQQAYASWVSIQSGKSTLQDVLELLDQPLPDYADKPIVRVLPFKHNIILKEIRFRYSAQTPYVLQKINLTIPKGSRVGFIGTTGSGKSTLIDIVMGLLQPTDGALEVDGQAVTEANIRSWQMHIAHVPQAIFLADSSIEENIAFGVPIEHIDHRRVKEAARQAQIADSIETWPMRYQTFVGERGIRLSGGQRQRIGIARALYKKSDVIVFDEATSALDNETELAVMQSIDGLSNDVTLLIIAHRLTTLKHCTLIVELDKGSVKRVGTYQEIVHNQIYFK